MSFHLAQFNLARMVAPLESEAMRGFVEGLEALNALADAAPGFVWRLRGEGDTATDLRPYGEDILINLSVWESLEALKAYTYQGAHLEYLRRRREWFVPLKERFLVLWWVPVGYEPRLQEGMERLEYLRRYGPTPRAFTLGQNFPPGSSQ
ncbi:DUF3291 domain-containing protein [Meiothermus granaticius]|uniref:DUF3291 domain-containing protein n=1 Tax=Meiothermus granaticius NBRC 107808 TaxID=1227551 RepID=A0A399F6W4_9DEIN|nr:DUF3291 domain-containing protein [Meiothermus granaticius]MCL6526021.1 DUF3291 domain-containing protein [Thermaceae bacterium]RIH91366.1 hypothetical protein Mgrana_02709 [Meiothermus granaticius NBRC 107808]GEM86929.1 hypothetical protein MGR01S_15540 [Meiothermus granaticius NBRC 107808]